MKHIIVPQPETFKMTRELFAAGKYTIRIQNKDRSFNRTFDIDDDGIRRMFGTHSQMKVYRTGTISAKDPRVVQIGELADDPGW